MTISKRVIPQFPVDKLHTSQKGGGIPERVCKVFLFDFPSSQLFISWRNVTTAKASNLSTNPLLQTDHMLLGSMGT